MINGEILTMGSCPFGNYCIRVHKAKIWVRSVFPVKYQIATFILIFYPTFFFFKIYAGSNADHNDQSN